MTDEHDPYMRGWENGACLTGMDWAFTERAAGDPIRQRYEIGYWDGRKARNAAANIATTMTGHVPTVLRVADGYPRHVFLNGNRAEAWDKLHHVASEPDALGGGRILIIGDPSVAAEDVIRTAPTGRLPKYLPAGATLELRNGVVAHVVSPGRMKTIRGWDIGFALVVAWPSEDDWWTYVEPTVRLGRAQIVAIDQPPASWSHVPGSDAP